LNKRQPNSLAFYHRLAGRHWDIIAGLILAFGAVHMETPNTILDRIFFAADSLYEEAGRDKFPSVDALGKTARVSIDDASAGMNLWRRRSVFTPAKASSIVGCS
jgi:hypothetical protein